MRKSQLVALLILAATFTLTACGQKGALYLTDDQIAQSAADAAAAAEEASKDKSTGSTY